MVPYRNACYWLSDFQGGRHAITKEEKFNQAHAKLRNVIERTFGVLKARFPILDRMTPYPFPTQRNIVIAYVAIHNYLQRTGVIDTWFRQFQDEDGVVQNPKQLQDNITNEDYIGVS
ncbi:hypothetical protein ACH5RR_020810 [Cinchona calisaya]|uniref:DDE Tnp4 domain-containing protein n=1 Tax=Cinchona calisaya TaxID=153742 RepID=A0ABD2ZFK6_9GENT